VVIIGGGFAALEAAVALRALADNRVQLTLVSPDPHFRYRPAATLEVFGGASPLVYDLRRLLDGIAAEYHAGRVVAASPQIKTVQVDSGRSLSYDKLVLATGAISQRGIPGAVTFRDQRDLPELRRVIEDARRGQVSELALVVPSGQSWPLPAYELALLTAAQLRGRHPRLGISVVTPEKAPMDVFGREISGLVAELLDESGVRFIGGVTPRTASNGALELEFEPPIRADRVISLPELRGQRIPGIPASWFGFIPTDSVGRIEDLTDAYAAGDATTFPIKQGGLAAQQADAIARTIASELGEPVHEAHPVRVLKVQLLGGERPLFLRSELDQFGQPNAPVVDQHRHGEEPSSQKVYARYLGPYLAKHQPLKALEAT
jgi:sulfide:quinone oxidoreductase